MARQMHTRFGKKSARLTQWIGPANQGFQNVAATNTVIIASASFEEPLTVLRVRGQVSISVATTADLAVIGAFGLGVVSAEAFAAGAASIPGPFDNGDWGGWFVWRSFSYKLEFGDATGFYFVPWTFEIDSKAMRKVSANEVVVFIAESQAGAFSLSAPLRMLVKLP